MSIDVLRKIGTNTPLLPPRKRKRGGGKPDLTPFFVYDALCRKYGIAEALLPVADGSFYRSKIDGEWCVTEPGLGAFRDAIAEFEKYGRITSSESILIDGVPDIWTQIDSERPEFHEVYRILGRAWAKVPPIPVKSFTERDPDDWFDGDCDMASLRVPRDQVPEFLRWATRHLVNDD